MASETSDQIFVNVKLELEKKRLFFLMLEAHKRDMTLNEFCNEKFNIGIKINE